MGLRDVRSREAVFRAMREQDALGREAFLAKYGFKRATKFVVVHDGKEYDSKALLAAAHGFGFSGSTARIFLFGRCSEIACIPSPNRKQLNFRKTSNTASKSKISSSHSAKSNPLLPELCARPGLSLCEFQ
jgi:hypothetical protein